MLVQPITVSPWQSNCYLVRASETATRTVIVDPGLTADAPVAAAVEELGLIPVALLGTHGHVDHVGDAHLLARRYDIPLYLAEADQAWLTRPGDGLGPRGGAMMRQLTGIELLPAVPDVRDLDAPFEVAGMSVTPFPAPGHTPGSTLLTVRVGDDEVVFTGDVLFRGTIGRTDLGGGSMARMRESLARITNSFPAGSTLLPGHGQPTTLAEELASNPYLQNL